MQRTARWSCKPASRVRLYISTLPHQHEGRAHRWYRCGSGPIPECGSGEHGRMVRHWSSKPVTRVRSALLALAAAKVLRKHPALPTRERRFDSGWLHHDVPTWRSSRLSKLLACGSMPQHVSTALAVDSARSSKALRAGSIPAESTRSPSANGSGNCGLSAGIWVRIP